MKALATIILLALVASGCAPAGQVVSSRGPEVSGSAELTASPSAEASAAGPESSATSRPAPDPSESPATDRAFAIGDWVVTDADGLNLRARPGSNADSQGRLPLGSTGIIAGGPEEQDGYAWYAIGAPGLPWGSGCATDPDPTLLVCPAWFGWVAAGDLQGNPWLRRADPPCPAAPTTASEFASTQPGLLYACFRNAALTLRAHVGPVPPYLECNLPYSVAPAWLFVCGRIPLQTSATDAPDDPLLMAGVHPSLGECDFGGRTPSSCPFAALAGDDVELTGHFDDPAAEDCIGEGVPNLDPVRVVHDCRMTWVITAVRQAGSR